MGEPSIGEWEQLLRSKLTRTEVAIFNLLRTSENIRAKMQENINK